MTAPEVWRPVAGFRAYQVSSRGRIRSTFRWRGRPGQVLQGSVDGYGYLRVTLYPGRRHRHLHTLVAEAFLGPRPDGLEVRHFDGDSLNNAVSNLRYGTRSENNLDAVRHGTHVQARKTHCPQDHPYDDENTYITPSTGDRCCWTCIRSRRAAAALDVAS